MKKLTLLLFVCAAFVAHEAYAAPVNTSNRLDRTARAASPVPLQPDAGGLVPDIGGDVFNTATVIPTLPYTDTGNTCAYVDNYSAPCFATGGRDVVYRYTPTVSGCVTISLCGSGFDTALHLYDGSPAALVACNDDYCGSNPQNSKLASVPLTGGHTYYIVVDGYYRDPFFGQDDCGNYVLSVTNDCPGACLVSCPAGAIPEGEPTCTTGYVDTYNAGCNSSPPTFQNLTCGPDGVTVCGTYGNYLDGSGNIFRDTDWYQVVVSTRAKLHLAATGEATTQVSIFSASAGCAAAPLVFAYGEPCQEAACEVTVNPGTYWLFVSSIFANPTQIPCGSRYVMTASCTPEAPAGMGLLHCNDASGVSLDIGRSVVASGVVTSNFPTASATRLTIQDATGAITVFGTPQSCASLGDMLYVTGNIAQFNGLNQLSAPLTITTLSTGNPQPAPLVLTPLQVEGSFHADNCEPDESRLVKVPDVFIRTLAGGMPAPGATFAANTNYRLIHAGPDSTTNFTTLRIVQTTNPCGLVNPLIGVPIPLDCPASVVGILSQFDTSSPFTGSYQIQPRIPGDIVQNCAVPAHRTTWGQVKAIYR